MKKALLKDSVKEIKNTYKRFISILLMAFLGVGFFAGLRATSPDMVETIDKYYDEQNVYDIQILSTLGLTKEDIGELEKIDNVENVIGSYETDGKIEIDNTEIVVKFITLEDLNKPILLSGNMPQNENECLVEESFLKANNKRIGDFLQAQIENSTNDDGEEIAYLKQNEIKIVGTIQSPLYIARDRGTSKLGAGKVNYYIYIPEENINASDIYTSIYIKVKDADKYLTSSSEYEDYIGTVKNDIEEIKEEREQARKSNLVAKAEEKVKDAENELNTQKEDAQKQIEDAKQEIEDGKSEIQSGEAEINSSKQKADKEFANAAKEIANAKAQIETSEKELESKENEANAKFEELEKQKKELQTNLSTINNGLNEANEQYNKILVLLKDTSLSETEKQVYEEQKLKLEASIAELNKNKQTIEAGINQINEGITSGKQELENGKSELEQAKTELSNKETELNKTKKQTYAKIETAKNELEESKQKIADAEQELNAKEQEFEEKIAEAEKSLSDAKEEILEIDNPKWYILDRNSNAGYVSFIQDTKSIENIGKVFPVVFFIVATLISLTSMTRMVEEQRMQIGTLKALRI